MSDKLRIVNTTERPQFVEYGGEKHMLQPRREDKEPAGVYDRIWVGVHTKHLMEKGEKAKDDQGNYIYVDVEEPWEEYVEKGHTRRMLQQIREGANLHNVERWIESGRWAWTLAPGQVFLEGKNKGKPDPKRLRQGKYYADVDPCWGPILRSTKFRKAHPGIVALAEIQDIIEDELESQRGILNEERAAIEADRAELVKLRKQLEDQAKQAGLQRTA